MQGFDKKKKKATYVTDEKIIIKRRGWGKRKEGRAEDKFRGSEQDNHE